MKIHAYDNDELEYLEDKLLLVNIFGFEYLEGELLLSNISSFDST